MVLKLVEKVNEKIDNGQYLHVACDCGVSRIMDTVVPDSINTEDGIYIEGENLILNITNDKEINIDFDEIEEEFIIHQGSVTYFLS